MTTNNYFGFTHSTQYSATPGTTYPTQQTGYSVTPGATAAAYPTQRTATGYETYQTQATPAAYAVPAGATTAATYDYGYARTAHSTPTAYDAKAYYQQQATPTTPVTPAYSTSDYQSPGAAIVKPQYSATYSTQTTPQRTVVPQKPAVSAVQYSQYATPPQQQQSPAAQAVGSYTPSYTTPATIQPTAPLNKAIGSAPRAITQRAPQQTVQPQTTGYQYTQRHPFKPQQQQNPQQVSQVQQLSQLQQHQHQQQVQQQQQLQQQQQAQQQQAQQQQQQMKKTYQTTPVSNVGSYQVNNASTAQAAFVAQSTAAATNSNYNKPKGGGYDAALFSAASSYINQQSGNNQNKPFYKRGGNFGNSNNPSGLKNLRPKAPPKSQQLHYCEVCKISCAGPLTYREHLEGQKHKKKEAAQKSDAPAPTISRGPIALHCDLCAVTCTGQDAYGAHIRGNKHQKVLKLHAMLGKPVPDIPEDPKILVAKTIAAAKANQNSSGDSAKKTVVVPPKVNFVASGQLSTTQKLDSKDDAKANIKSNQSLEPKTEDIEMAAATLLENDVTPVGHEFVEEIKDDLGKLVSFHCKLCECKFNDPNAKDMHMKGRRHRLAFKKKVNPNLQVDLKPSFKHKRGFEEKNRRSGGGGGGGGGGAAGARDEFMRNQRNMHWQDRMMEVEERMYWDERRRFEEEMEYFDWCRRSHDPRGMLPPPFPPGPGPRMMGPPFMPPPPPPQQFPRRLDTTDDRHVIARHAAVYPNEQELKDVQKIVSHTEKALKLVSDHLTENALAADKTKNGSTEIKTEVKTEKPETPQKATPNKKGQKNKEDGRDGSLFSFEKETETRVLKGVMRVESLAKGLLLHGDTSVKLVVLCSEKPTRQLLVKVAANLTPQLQIVAPEDAYVINMKSEEATITVQTKTEPKLTVSVILTSPLLREQVNVAAKPGESGDAPAAQSTPDPPDLLNKKKCLDALAALRHAKWFQARVAGMQNCLMIIRIFRDLCQRVPTWAPFSPWAMELLCEKALTSAGMPLSPGDSLRRVLEAVSSGLLLSNGPGIVDPCEKEPVDAAANLTPQQREDITASAQHALRLLAFRQIHKVLGMEPLPAPPPMPANKFNNRGGFRYGRKRRRDNSNGETTDSDAGVNEKKDKKDTDVVIKVEPTTKPGGTVATPTPAAATKAATASPAAKTAAAAATKGSLKSPAAKPGTKK